MRIVLDVNVLASSVLKIGSVPWIVVEITSGTDHQLVLSEEMVAKLDEVLTRPYFASRIPDSRRIEFFDRIRKLARPEAVDKTITGFADDTEDDIVLGTAVAGSADVIVTGDKGLLALNPFRGIAIVTARDFLDLIDS